MSSTKQIPLILSFFLSVIILFSLGNCNDSDDNDDDNISAELKVAVYVNDTNTIYTNGATVSLHLSEDDMNKGISYKTAISNSSGFCNFKGLGVSMYYVKGSGTVGSFVYTGDTIVTTILGKEVIIDLVLKEGVDTTIAAYNNADGIKGGKLYSKFYADQTFWNVPGGINEADIKDYGNFYRCKQCHGWDLDGKTGAYIDRNTTIDRPSVAGSLRSFIASNTNKQLFTAIKNTGGRLVNTSLTYDGTKGDGDPMPDYGTILTNEEIWNIVKFLKEEAFDVSQLYDIIITGTYPTGTKTFENVGKNGDSLAGQTYYVTKCSPCHGLDGKTINMEGKSIGGFIRQKPYETQHKVKFGHLGSIMTGYSDASIDDVKNLFKAGTDTLAFPDL